MTVRTIHFALGVTLISFQSRCVSSFISSSARSTSGQSFLSPVSRPIIISDSELFNSGNCDEIPVKHVVDFSATRRVTVAAFLSFPLFGIQSNSAEATTGSIKTSQYTGSSATSKSKVKPEVAFERLVLAREELERAGKTYLSKNDYDGLREYLADQATNMNDFEGNALTILASKKLDDEDKKSIGTIRRYGAGADVLIMYGGLLAEIDEGNDEPDHATVQKYLTRTMESLDEVIAICRNSGLGS